MGGIPYTRVRDREFDTRNVTTADLVQRIESLHSAIPDVVVSLTQAQLDAPYPEPQWGELRVTSQFLFHLYGHFNYHLGQIGYLRRILTQGPSVKFVQL